MKFVVKLCIVFLVLGGVLFATGHALGGVVYSSWYNGRLYPWNMLHRVGTSAQDPASVHMSASDDHAEYDGSPPTNRSIRDLSLHLTNGNCVITRGDAFSVSGAGSDSVKH